MGQSKRRRLLAALGATTVAIPLSSLAQMPRSTLAQQQGKMLRIGFLFPGTLSLRPQVEAFYQGLRALGYVEGQNIVIERREAKGKYENLAALAHELAALRPDVIVASTTVAAQAMQKATSTIPIVIMFVSDPIKAGLTKSLARPSGNVTGCSSNPGEVTQRRLQLLKELVPSMSRVAVLWNSQSPPQADMVKEAHQGAQQLGLQIESLGFGGRDGLQTVLTNKVVAQGLLVLTDAVLTDNRAAIASFATVQGLAAIGMFAEEARAGMLASYGISLWDEFRRAAPYVDRILRGAKPADLPIEQPTQYEFVINLKTAKALGLTVPRPVLVRANEVIE